MYGDPEISDKDVKKVFTKEVYTKVLMNLNHAISSIRLLGQIALEDNLKSNIVGSPVTDVAQNLLQVVERALIITNQLGHTIVDDSVENASCDDPELRTEYEKLFAAVPGLAEKLQPRLNISGTETGRVKSGLISVEENELGTDTDYDIDLKEVEKCFRARVAGVLKELNTVYTSVKALDDCTNGMQNALGGRNSYSSLLYRAGEIRSAVEAALEHARTYEERLSPCFEKKESEVSTGQDNFAKCVKQDLTEVMEHLDTALARAKAVARRTRDDLHMSEGVTGLYADHLVSEVAELVEDVEHSLDTVRDIDKELARSRQEKVSVKDSDLPAEKLKPGETTAEEKGVRYRKKDISKFFLFTHIKDGEKSTYAFQGRHVEHYLRMFGEDAKRGELLEFEVFDSPPATTVGWQGDSVMEWVPVEEENSSD